MNYAVSIVMKGSNNGAFFQKEELNFYTAGIIYAVKPEIFRLYWHIIKSGQIYKKE